MNRIFILIAIVSMFLLTTIVGVTKPALNKPVAINSGVIVAQIEEPIAVNPETKIENVEPPKVDAKIAPVVTPTKKAEAKVTPVSSPKQQQQKVQQKSVKKVEKTSDVKSEQKTVEPVVEKIVEAEKPVIEQVQETPKEPKKKVLTEEEEIIAWNKWRSEIQNSIMRDYNVPVQLGTTYNMSFSVDKWGNISNLSVGCGTSYCPKAGTDNVRSLILGLGAKGLLKFPEGTQRIMTVVKGSFVVVDTDPRYSRPEDFSDYEVIKRQVER